MHKFKSGDKVILFCDKNSRIGRNFLGAVGVVEELVGTNRNIELYRVDFPHLGDWWYLRGNSLRLAL